jgi:predicted dehydrogenase
VSIPPLRTALVGLGRMGRAHLAALDAVAEIDVVALAEPSAPSMELAAARRPAAVRYEDVAAALAHPGLEACLVATPTPSHPEIVAAALDAGLHVLCEKPLSLDPAAGDELGPLAATRGRVLQIGFWRRFSPPWRAAKARIDRGDVGIPLYVRLAQWDGDPPPPAFCDPAVSGGLAVDCGVHEYDLAEWLTGRRVVRVSAWALPIVDDDVGRAGDLDNLVAVLELDGGAVATVDLSRNARFGDDVRTEVLGSNGALLVESLPHGRTRVGTGAGLHDLAGSEADDAMAAGVAEQARAFAAAARGAAVDVPDAAASGRATRIGRAVIEAARSGQAVAVEEVASR